MLLLINIFPTHKKEMLYEAGSLLYLK
jgi:hypothetical protein